MPVLSQSTYRAPPGFGSGHLQTVFPTLFRRAPRIAWWRERLELPDGDFLDLDWHAAGAGRLAILSHGLEGSSQSAYVRGMAAALVRRGWDVLAWNCRGCGGELNRLPRFYHSGATEDLAAVLEHARRRGPRTLALVGFSLGGNLTLKLLGELGERAPAELRAAVAFSVPCDLAASAARMAAWSHRIYMARFLRSLGRKVELKRARWPARMPPVNVAAMNTFAEFDEKVTAPLHGFSGAADYWARASSRPFLGAIRVPTLLVNARNDPFLAPACFPEREAEISAHLFLEMPASGGHCGFVTLRRSGEYWSERRAAEFLGGPATG